MAISGFEKSTYKSALKGANTYLTGLKEPLDTLEKAITRSVFEIQNTAQKHLKSSHQLKKFLHAEYEQHKTLLKQYEVANHALHQASQILKFCTPEKLSFLSSVQISHLKKLEFNMKDYEELEVNLMIASQELRQEITKLETLVSKTEQFINTYKHALNRPAYELRVQLGQWSYADYLPAMNKFYYFDQGFQEYQKKIPESENLQGEVRIVETTQFYDSLDEENKSNFLDKDSSSCSISPQPPYLENLPAPLSHMRARSFSEPLFVLYPYKRS